MDPPTYSTAEVIDPQVDPCVVIQARCKPTRPRKKEETSEIDCLVLKRKNSAELPDNKGKRFRRRESTENRMLEYP